MFNKKFVSCNDCEDPTRGFSAVMIQGMFQHMTARNDGNLEVVCLSVHFPTLCFSKADPVLYKALRECRSVIDCGVDLTFYQFQLPRLDSAETTGRFRVVLFVQGGSVCSGVKLRNGLEEDLKRLLGETPFFVTLHRPEQDEYQRAMVRSDDNLPALNAWMGHYLQDARPRHAGKIRYIHLFKPKKLFAMRWVKKSA